MANKTIHQLTPASTVASDFEFAIYDTDSDSTKKATASQILDTEDLLYADDEDEPSEEVDFTSQDTSLSPSESVSVDLLSGNDSWSQRFVKISQMFKNIRYLFSKIGSITMGTTATTLTGAIAEHEFDISTLNSKIIDYTDVSGTIGTTQYAGYYFVDLTIPSGIRDKLLAFSVISSYSNRPTSAVRVGTAAIRVYCDQSEKDVTLRIVHYV